MYAPYEAFAEACRTAFMPLITRYGFAPQEVEPIGRECYVRFHKGPRTVSVAWEPGSNPIVEFFYPCGPNDQATPWAARGNVPYSRRIPHLVVKLRFDPDKPETVSAYLGATMQELADKENAFLQEADNAV